MKFEDFKSGVWVPQYQYKSFLPTLINTEWNWDDPRINVLLEEATRKLGELNAFTIIVPDVDLFIQMHIVKEANTSSRIEGTKTEMDEVVLEEESVPPERRDDWRKVRNYVQAMNTAIDELSRLPISLRLLRHTHEILMSGARGEHKTPGEFRRSQNWIGGSSLADAAFIPPHFQDIPDLLSDLEAFWHNETINVPHLIRCALSHYQFETIHPFQDGNGRIGRLLIPLYFISHGLLNKPSLYLSSYLEKHRGSYYDALTRVRESNDLGHWVRFFLQAMIVTAEKGKRTFQRILSLRQEVDQKILSLGRRAENAQKLMLQLYSNPAVRVNNVADLLDLKYYTANLLVQSLVDIGILKEITGWQRNRIFFFQSYFEVFRDDV